MLLDDPACTSVSVLCRNTSLNRLPGVSYYAADITRSETLVTVLAEIKPRVIIHTAAASAAADYVDHSIYQKINVDGTANLLSCAAKAPSVTAFVYTSTASVVAGSDHKFIKETAPVLNSASNAHIYDRTKAIAETFVLKANDPRGLNGKPFRTVCLRPTAIYGERDQQVIRSLLDSLQKRGVTRTQLGNNTNLFDWNYVGNAASAHVLAAKALLASELDRQANRVDGEAFFITDDNPLPFWDFARKVWAAAGDRTRLEDVWVVPASPALAIASIAEWVLWAVSFGRKRAKIYTRQRVEWCCLNRTFCIDKAKDMLGYIPVSNTDEAIRKAVAWALEDRAARVADGKEA